MLWAYLRETSSARLIRTSAYDDLDATEKSGVSYALGMAITKIFAARQLSIPWLMHLDRYRQVFGVRLKVGRSRPDLIGPRDVNAQRDWIVAEAKGRTHGLDADAIKKMRLQKRRVLTIQGQRPLLYMGAAAHFTNDVLECRVIDPPARGEITEMFAEIDDAKRRFVRAYYQPFLDLLEDGERTDGGWVLRELPEADVTLGMSGQLITTLRGYLGGDGPDPFLGADGFDDAVSNTSFLGDDGVLVDTGASWSHEAMLLEPGERGAGRRALRER